MTKGAYLRVFALLSWVVLSAGCASTGRYDGRVTFLDDSYFVMEIDQKPCDTRPRRYSPVADEIRVPCQGRAVTLTLSLAEGQIVGLLTGPVPSMRSRRVCDQYSHAGGKMTCTKWGEVREEISVQGSGTAEVVRVGG